MRVHIQQDRNRVINRIGRLLETASIKLGSVASSIAGKSGRAILKRLAEGSQQPEQLAKLALGRLKEKTPDLILALDGRTDVHFRRITVPAADQAGLARRGTGRYRCPAL